MIVFLDKNYLDEAVLQRRSFLSQCLLTIPTHIDQFEPYPHKGKIDDDKYRFLWKKIKADDEFLQDASLRITSDIEKLTFSFSDTIHNESFESERCQNTSVTECINFNLCDDVIPSSNPGSPDLFLSDDEDGQSSNIFTDNFEKEDLKLLSVSHDHFKIETRLADTEALTNKVPSLSKLISRLTPMVTIDPLTNKDGRAIKEKDIFRESGMLPSNVSRPRANPLVIDVHAIEENIEKKCLSNSLKQDEIEEVITDTIELQTKEHVYQALTTMLGTNLKSFEPEHILKDQPLKEDFNNNIVKGLKDVSVNMLAYSTQASGVEEITFLDINEPVETEIDRLCEDAILDTPLSASPAYRTDLDLPKCDPIELSPYTPKFLDQEKKCYLGKRCFSPELYCNETQANRLAEPYNLETEIESGIPEKRIEQIKEMIPLVCQSTACEDLQLSWEIVKLTDLRKDPTHNFDTLDTGKTEHTGSDVTETFTKSNFDDYEDTCPSEDDLADSLESMEQTVVQEEDRLAQDEPEQWNISQELMPIDVNYDRDVEDNIQNDNRSDKDNNNTEGKPNPLNLPGDKFSSAKLPNITEFGFDPLGDFMALRSKKKDTVIKKLPSDTLEETESDKSNALPIEKGLKKDDCINTKQVSVVKKKTKHHLVKVRLSDSYEDLVLFLEKAAVNHIVSLKNSDDITRSCSFKTLSPDITRFLIKQREKYHLDNNINGVEDSTYKNIVCVHGLVGAADIVTNCCLESAVAFLHTIHDKYKLVIQDSLESVHQELFKVKAELSHRQIYHPKMAALCTEIEVWLKKKRAKSGDNEQKILVIVKQNIPSLMTTLKKVLGLSKWLQPDVAESLESHALIESLDIHNCLILHTHQIRETFPWAQFSLVVEYEYQDNSGWKEYCERQNIRHMSLVLEQQSKQDASVDGDWKSEHSGKQISMVASHQVTTNSTLLQLLEAKYNIQLYERDYTLLHGCKALSFSDLDIDENTAIITEDIACLREDRTLHNVVTRIVALSLKYTTCYCLFYNNDSAASIGYQFPSHVIGNLSKLHTAMFNFGTRSKTGYKTKILVCPDVQDLAMMIRRISVDTMMSNTDTERKCLDRSWLTTEFTLGEKFLMQSPCLSSFNAQLMLKTIGLRGCLENTADQILETVPGISKTTLTKFHETVHQQHHKRQEHLTFMKQQIRHSDKDQEINKSGRKLPSDKSSNHQVNILDNRHATQSFNSLSLEKGISTKNTFKSTDKDDQIMLLEQSEVCYREHPNKAAPVNKDLSRVEGTESKDITPTSYSRVYCSNGNDTKPRSQTNQELVLGSYRSMESMESNVLSNSHDQSRGSRRTPARKLEFGNRTLTKPEESFRKLYGPKEDKSRTSYKKQQSVQNDFTKVPVNKANMRPDKPEYAAANQLNLLEHRQTGPQTNKPNMQLYASDQIQEKANQKQQRHDLLQTGKIGMQHTRPNPANFQEVNQSTYRPGIAETDRHILLNCRPNESTTDQFNLHQFRSEQFPDDDINLQWKNTDIALLGKDNLLCNRSDKAEGDSLHLQQYGPDQFLGNTYTSNLQQNRSVIAQTDKENWLHHMPDKVSSDQFYLQNFAAGCFTGLSDQYSCLQQNAPVSVTGDYGKHNSLQQNAPVSVAGDYGKHSSLQQNAPVSVTGDYGKHNSLQQNAPVSVTGDYGKHNSLQQNAPVSVTGDYGKHSCLQKNAPVSVTGDYGKHNSLQQNAPVSVTGDYGKHSSLQQNAPVSVTGIYGKHNSLPQNAPVSVTGDYGKHSSLQQNAPVSVTGDYGKLPQYKPDQVPTKRVNLQHMDGVSAPTYNELTSVNQRQALPDESSSDVGLFQNVIGKWLETFDYNHGLPDLTTNKEGGLSSPRGSADDSLITRRDLRRQLMASLIVQEYPPANEVEKLHYTECDKIDLSHREDVVSPNQLNINVPESRPRNDSSYDPEAEKLIESTLFKDNIIKSVHYQEHLPTLSYVADKENNFVLKSKYAKDNYSSANANDDYSSTKSMFDQQDKNERRSISFKELDMVSQENTHNRNNQSETFLNPTLQRISLKPICFPTNNEGADQDENYSTRQNFEDDLREATRRFLQNSENLPRFESNTNRYPIQKRTIGLAQPLQREKTEDGNQQSGEVIPRWSHEEKRKMQQSPWATADSPPMDLEYEDSPVDRRINLHGYGGYGTEIINRSVFTGQTPQKKRKLTYQKIPGKKGQTKLVFY